MAVGLSASSIDRALHPDLFIISIYGTQFCYRLSKPQGLVRQDGLDKLITLNCLILSRTRALPACGIAPQPLRYHHAP
jgi:hypothetical protein